MFYHTWTESLNNEFRPGVIVQMLTMLCKPTMTFASYHVPLWNLGGEWMNVLPKETTLVLRIKWMNDTSNFLHLMQAFPLDEKTFSFFFFSKCESNVNFTNLSTHYSSIRRNFLASTMKRLKESRRNPFVSTKQEQLTWMKQITCRVSATSWSNRRYVSKTLWHIITSWFSLFIVWNFSWCVWTPFKSKWFLSPVKLLYLFKFNKYLQKYAMLSELPHANSAQYKIKSMLTVTKCYTEKYYKKSIFGGGG